MDLAIDTSAIMAVILNEPSKARLLEETRGADLTSAPSLPWEVGNALSALLRRDRLGLPQARQALDSFRRIPVRYADVELDAALVVAREHHIYAYDAYLLVCARRYRMPLLSLDRNQCRVARDMNLDVIEIAA